MKPIYKLLLFMLSTSLAFVFIGTSYKSDETPIALVKKIIKDVQYKASDESDWEIAQTGKPLSDGGEVKTGHKSLALVLFTDGSGLLRVKENSVLHIYGNTEDKKLNKNTFIQKGTVGFEVNKQGDEEFKFTTPTMVASIRGTEGYIKNDIEGEFSTEDCIGTTELALRTGTADFQATCGNRESGSVSGGEAVQFNEDGAGEKQLWSGDQQNTYDNSKKSDTKKIIIETPEGIFEIEYYPENEGE